MKFLSVIEVSPSFVEMILCQKSKDSYEVIERVREEINLFKGYQKTGKISFEKSQKLCEILRRMKELSESYGIYSIQTVTTSSFNQLSNSAFLVDQIKIHTGLEVSMPKLLEKKKLLFKKFLIYRDQLAENRKSCLILNIGSSTTDLVFLHSRKLIKNQIISTGSYKAAEMISEEGLTPGEALSFMGDYIYNYLLELRKELGRKTISRLVLIGEVKDLLNGRWEDDSPVMKMGREDLKGILEEMEEYSFKNFAARYNISEMMVLKAFVELSMVEVITSEFTIGDISVLSYDSKELIVYENFYPEGRRELEEQMWKLTLQAARALGEKYHFNLNHSEFTRDLSKQIFEALRERYNIFKGIYRYLEIAAYLHDTGKYINFREHNRHSQYIARNSYLFGLTEEELEFISYMCYAHSGDEHDYQGVLEGMDQRMRIDILKGAGILKIATALDRSKRQKAEKIEVDVDRESVNIRIYTRQELVIEKLFFNKQIGFFKEVFGLTPKLFINRRYYGESI